MAARFPALPEHCSVDRTLRLSANDDREHSLDPGRLLAYLDAARARPLPAEPVAAGQPISRARLDDDAWLRKTSARVPYASAFLLTSPNPDTTIDDAEFRDAVWMRLGLPAALGHTQCDPPWHEDPPERIASAANKRPPLASVGTMPWLLH